MRYYEYIKYKRIGDMVYADRVSGAHGHHSVKSVSIASLFRGHTAWCADQIKQYETKRVVRGRE